MILNPAKYCIAHRHRLHGQVTKQPSSGFEPQKLWKSKTTLVASSCLQKNKCIPNMLIFHIDVWQNFNVFWKPITY